MKDKVLKDEQKAEKIGDIEIVTDRNEGGHERITVTNKAGKSIQHVINPKSPVVSRDDLIQSIVAELGGML